MAKIPFTSPRFQLGAFNCPLCGAYADQVWGIVQHQNPSTGHYGSLDGTQSCHCAHCHDYSIWFQGKMVYPDFSGVELPNEDLIDDIKSDYLEAASIVAKSPCGAAALLRLAIQKLCIELGEKGVDLNTDIGNLVKKGLPQKVQQSLDTLRVIGAQAVHPGQLELKDDIDTVSALFRLVNFIATKLITEHNEIDEIYSKIPDGKKEQIAKRDGEK